MSSNLLKSRSTWRLSRFVVLIIFIDPKFLQEKEKQTKAKFENAGNSIYLIIGMARTNADMLCVIELLRNSPIVVLPPFTAELPVFRPIFLR